MAAGRVRRAVIAGALLIAAVGLPSSAAAPADDQIDTTRVLIQEWVEVQRLISKEKRDWAVGKEMLNERIELVEQQIASLRTKIADAEANIADADRKRAELIVHNDKLKETSKALADIVAGLESRTRELLKRLPDPIIDRVKPLTQGLPEDPNNTTLSLGERFQYVAGILNAINKFDREISVSSEVRTLPDGTAASVTALYLGIGHGYYVNDAGTIAGIGTAGENGWEWRQANEAAQAIADAIAILQNEKVAEYVQLPARIE